MWGPFKLNVICFVFNLALFCFLLWIFETNKMWKTLVVSTWQSPASIQSCLFVRMFRCTYLSVYSHLMHVFQELHWFDRRKITFLPRPPPGARGAPPPGARGGPDQRRRVLGISKRTHIRTCAFNLTLRPRHVQTIRAEVERRWRWPRGERQGAEPAGLRLR